MVPPMMNRIIAFLSILLIIIILLSLTNSSTYTLNFEVDAVASVIEIIDGDTFDSSIGRIRLADINAPELDEPGGYKAKEALTYIISGKTVYLDIDDIYGTDIYGRIIAVVYIRYNSTHLLNVNKWLLDNRYAEIDDYPNEFNPYTWSLYVYYPYEETPSTTTKMPPNMLINSININITRIKELYLGDYEKLLYLQPYIHGNSIRIFVMYKYNATHNNIIIYDSNGTILINTLIPEPIQSYIYRSPDLSKYIFLRPHGYPDRNTSIYIIDLDNLKIQIIEIPFEIGKITLYGDLIAFKIPYQDKIKVINISSGYYKTYTLNISEDNYSLLLATHNIALLSTSYHLYVYDYINNRSIERFSCESSSLIDIDKRYALIECVSCSRKHIYRSYIVLDLILFNYKVITTYEGLSYDLLTLFDTDNTFMVFGYVNYSPLGIGGSSIYILNDSNDYSWYRSIDIDNYMVVQGPGKTSFYDEYVLLILNKGKYDQYGNIMPLTDSIALLAVDPYSEAYNILYIISNDSNFSYSLTYVIDNYLFVSVIRDGEVYLELFKIDILKNENEVYIIEMSYISTIATITYKETITRTECITTTKTLTKTSTITYSLEPITITKTRISINIITFTVTETDVRTIMQIKPTTLTYTVTTYENNYLILIPISMILLILAFVIIIRCFNSR